MTYKCNVPVIFVQQYTWAWGLWSQGYDLSAITTCNLHSKYSPLTAMLICPVITSFYIKFLAFMTWKWAKLFDFSLPILKLVVILSMWYVAISASVLQILFILESKPPFLVERCLRNHYINFGGELTFQSQKQQFSTTLAVKLKLVAIVARESPWCHH